MSGMDRLTDELLDETLLNQQCWDFVDWLSLTGSQLSGHSFNHIKPKLRDLILAHRRASQAAPAPQDADRAMLIKELSDAARWRRLPDNENHLATAVLFERAVAALSAAPAPSDGLREAARLILSQPKRPDTLTAEAFHAACGFLDEQDGGEETTNEIIEAFLKHIAGED